MSESAAKRGRPRVYDAQRAREAMLDAAEAVFAQHGFEGTSMDAIAQTAGYTKSLLFHYFGDKLGLYTAVLGRIDQEANELLARLFAPVLEDETASSSAYQFRTFLETLVQAAFDYVVAHPRVIRLLTWEMAGEWQTFAQIASHFPTEVTDQFEALFHRAWQAGWLRSDFMPVIQYTMIFQICQAYLVALPMYQTLLLGKDLSSASAFTRAREYLVHFVVAGMMGES